MPPEPSESIRTERLLLRRWQPADRAPFAALNADPRVMEHFPGPLTRAQSDALVDRIEEHFTAHGYGLWAVERDGCFVGFTGVSWIGWEADFTPALEIGWRLAFPAWGHGYASEAAVAALVRAFEHVDSVVSLTAMSNVRSQRVMSRIGLRYERAFDHPALPEGHRLRRHVLYRADRRSWPGAPRSVS